MRYINLHFTYLLTIVQNEEKYPPPWLIAMQRYGPPPSYPTLKIPGLTAPIPEVCYLVYSHLKINCTLFCDIIRSECV